MLTPIENSKNAKTFHLGMMTLDQNIEKILLGKN